MCSVEQSLNTFWKKNTFNYAVRLIYETVLSNVATILIMKINVDGGIKERQSLSLILWQANAYYASYVL